MSVSENDPCMQTETDFRIESYPEPVVTRVWNHSPALTQDHLGIWAISCVTCGELMLGTKRDRLDLIHALQAQINRIEP